MGLLRFLLALSVAWTHAGLPKGLSGDLCVTVFFVISGFYMAMVLSENPAYGKISTFYQQRLLRLFPTYWALLALALLAGAMTSSIEQGWATVLALQLPQDHPGLFAGWVGLTLASCAIRVAGAYGMGLVEDPWATRFFPSELAFFLVGMLAYRLVSRPDARLASLRGAAYFAICAVAVGSMAANNFGHVNAGLLSKAAVVTLALTVAIPWLFMLTRHNRLDRHVGEYSYPLYLCHVLVFELWGLLKWSSPWSGYLMIAAAIALAVLLTVAVDKPVDRFRHRLLRAK